MLRRALIPAAVAILVMVTALAVSAPSNASPPPPPQHVVFVHGWRGTAASWDTAAAAYVATVNGVTTHQLSLPRDGSQAGDTAINAAYIESYIAANGLTGVQLDGHSLGAWAALYVARVGDGNAAVQSIVLRDPAETGGLGCFVVPDACSGSAMITAVTNAKPALTPPVLNLTSHTTVLPGETCHRIYTGISHPDFQTNAAVNAAATAWPVTSPCGSTPTATPTPKPTPTCSWLQRLWGLCR